MAGVRVVTDSTADIPGKVLEDLGISSVPLHVHWDGETYRDGVDITTEVFYRRLATSSTTPKTSQPSVGAFVEVFQRLLDQGADGIVSVHISGKLSGTHASAQQAAQQVAPGRIRVVDSETLSMALGWVAIAAAGAAAAGQDLQACERVALDTVPRVRLYVVFDTLEYLRRGGRIGRVQAFAGALLNIKPIVQVMHGELIPIERVRTRSKAIQRLVELTSQLPALAEISVLYSADPEVGHSLKEALQPILPGVDIGIYETGSVIGTHAGPGVVGCAVLLSG